MSVEMESQKRRSQEKDWDWDCYWADHSARVQGRGSFCPGTSSNLIFVGPVLDHPEGESLVQHGLSRWLIE